MRLTCPNCAAEYEVPEDVIPAEGRDVQCSNCGQTWFQTAAGSAAAETPAHDFLEDSASQAPEEAAAAAEVPEPDSPPSAPDAAADHARQPMPETDAAGHGAEDDIEEASEDVFAEAAEAEEDVPAARSEDTQAEQAEPQPQRSRGLDPALTDILREEAEREASLRAAETQSLETQPDLGLEEATAPEDEAARRSRQARDRMARMRGEDPRQLAAAETGSRKELLPDIEEINSTLRSAGSAAPVPLAIHDAPPARRKSSFARGFSLSLIAALVMVMVYDNASLIAEKVPQADSALSSYVSWVDQIRLWLDALVKPQASAE